VAYGFFFILKDTIPKDSFSENADPKIRFSENAFPQTHPNTSILKPEVV
jgi:hypothetical protein